MACKRKSIITEKRNKKTIETLDRGGYMNNMNKKYYWLKLQKDFFKRHDIRIIENMPNGKDYILFYLKLLCEATSHDGNLRFSDTIPYSVEMLSTITNTNVDIVRSAIKIFNELHMIEILDDGTYFMNEIQKMIGSETEWAKKKREYREKQKLLPMDNQRTKKDNVRQEIEKEIEKELDIEIEKEEVENKNNYQKIADLYNKICVSFPKVKKISEQRKKAIRARLNVYTIDDFKNLFEIAEKSDFLKGNNQRNWIADFDWLLNDSNIVKVLEGKYNNRKEKTENGNTITNNKSTNGYEYPTER